MMNVGIFLGSELESFRRLVGVYVQYNHSYSGAYRSIEEGEIRCCLRRIDRLVFRWYVPYKHFLQRCWKKNVCTRCIGESFTTGILHLAGINNFALTESLALKDGFFVVHQTPNLPSYVPSS